MFRAKQKWVISFALLLIVKATAQTWDGGTGNANWKTKNNWDTNDLPVSSPTTAIVFSGGSQPLTIQNISNNFQINSITFSSGMTTNFSISGNSFSLTGASPSIIQNSSFTGEISSNLGLSTNITLSGTGTGTLTLSGALFGAGGMTKTSANLTILSGNNTFTGPTTISAGTLQASSNGALGSTTAVTINAGGTLLLSGAGVSDRVNNSASINLNGGTISASGNLTETLGALTLSANSMIDMGAGSSSLTFASIANPGSSSLTVSNWTAGGIDRLYFTNTSGLTPAFLTQIQFSGYGIGATIIGNELVPISSAIPESDNFIGGLIVLILIAGNEYRRYSKRKKTAALGLSSQCKD